MILPILRLQMPMSPMCAYDLGNALTMSSMARGIHSASLAMSPHTRPLDRRRLWDERSGSEGAQVRFACHLGFEADAN